VPILPCAAVKAAADFNILGIISFSVFFAVVLSSLGPQADSIISTINILNVVIERMVKAILAVSPVGIASIIAARVISTCSLSSMAERYCALGDLARLISVFDIMCSMGLFMFTVVFSLAVHTLAVLPLLYFILTRRNPYSFMRAMSQVTKSLQLLLMLLSNDDFKCTLASGIHDRLWNIFICRNSTRHNPVLRARRHQPSTQQLCASTRGDHQHERHRPL
jgi:Na+/H+-dicarboxylate symporter